MDSQTRFHQDLPKISHRPLQDLGQDLHIIMTSESALWNSRKIVLEGPSRYPIRSLCQGLWESLKMSTTESCPRCTKWQEGSATAPQCEQSDMHKLMSRLRVRWQNEHRTTTRAIWHAQMTKGLHEHRLEFHQVRAPPWKVKAENVTDNVLPGFSLSLKYFTCPEMSLRHPKYSNCPKWWSASARPKNVTRRFQLFKTPPKIIHYCACHEKWPWRPPLISSHACRFVLATCTKYWAFRADEKVSDVPRVTNLLHLSPKTYTLQKQTRHARENACLRAHISRETSFENGRSKNFCAGTEPN